MDGEKNLTTNVVGLCLLPSDLLQDIFLRLALPEILRLRSVSKSLSSVISASEFHHLYGLRSSSETWLFLYKKRSGCRGSFLQGFSDRSDRWFQIPLGPTLVSAAHPSEDLYFLTASGDFFLFSSNGRGQLIAINLAANAVKKIPPSPLGPRGTSSWRRSGLKLVAGLPGSNQFRFYFAELCENRPILFSYCSEADTWQSLEASDSGREPTRVNEKDRIFLSVIHRRRESIIISTGSRNDSEPVVFRPRFDGGMEEGLAVGLVVGHATDRLHVYGDGKMVVVRSDGGDEKAGVRVVISVELWGLSLDGRGWAFLSKVPSALMVEIRKPYAVMMGSLEERDGIIRVVLLSNYKGVWDIIWLCYDVDRRAWTWVPLPDDGAQGLNMAGIAFSSALGLRT